MTIIEAHHISKKYTISKRANTDDFPPNRVTNNWSITEYHPKETMEDFWALTDISFSIKENQRVGIIGRNGSGKSTLLKILSRIIQPTSGHVIIRGRVASLLEIGTGFHPELSGKENIFLNGAILGMTKKEILKRINAIIAFAEIERFLDTPVKYYSSGMYMRLAFSIAAHLEPDILIVDEVLAVGDIDFQKKCLAKIQEMCNEGTTAVFVAHNLRSIENLCDHVILLDNGALSMQGDAHSVLEKYRANNQLAADTPLKLRIDRSGNGIIKYIFCDLLDETKKSIKILHSEQYLEIKCQFQVTQIGKIKNVIFAISVDSTSGRRISFLRQEITDLHLEDGKDIGEFSVKINQLLLTPGDYGLSLYCWIDGVESDSILNTISFKIENSILQNKLYNLLPKTNPGDVIILHDFYFSGFTRNNHL